MTVTENGTVWSLVQPWKTAGNQVMITVWSRRKSTIMFSNENCFNCKGDNRAQICGGPFLFLLPPNKGGCACFRHFFSSIIKRCRGMSTFHLPPKGWLFGIEHTEINQHYVIMYAVYNWLWCSIRSGSGCPDNCRNWWLNFRVPKCLVGNKRLDDINE